MELYITIFGTIITVIGTGVTLWQAYKVKSYSKRIAYDLRKIHLSEVIDNLKRAQDEGRKLISQVVQLKRGKNNTTISENIQKHIDYALNLIHVNGSDNDVRNKILEAQFKFRDFQSSEDQVVRETCVSEMHALIQETVSLSKERILTLEIGEKHD
jgi:hypothetical protein